MTSRDRSDEVATTADRAAGASVTADALTRPLDDTGTTLFDLLAPDEQPQYLLVGTMVDLESADGGEDSRRRKMAAPGGVAYTLVTDRAVRFVVQYRERFDEQVLRSAEIHAATVESVGSNNRFRVETDSGAVTAYPGASTAEECTAAAAFVSRLADDTTAREDDPLAALERLTTLHERGAVTDAEFEAKKRDLLDRI